ncbi:MAG: ECF transporter S component [Tissierellia bacterium]|nr:ECF transporter S component [Tissierellia bacterium]
MDTKVLTRTALFMALVTVATMVVNIPIPATKGYLNASETAVFLSAALLPVPYGIVAAGFGCALADILLGYTYYAPATLIIKAIEAAGAIFLMKRIKLPVVVVFALASLLMPLGYFLYEVMLYGVAAASAAAIPNLLQGLFGAVLAGIIHPVLKSLFPQA